MMVPALNGLEGTTPTALGVEPRHPVDNGSVNGGDHSAHDQNLTRG